MNEFRPFPLLGNPHLQTLLGLWLGGDGSRRTSVERRVLLPDGDQLVLHDTISPGWRHGAPIALLVHGLGGSHRSGYMERVAGQLARVGVRVVRMDLRGVGRGAAVARKTYNAACSADVRTAAAEVRAASPASPLVLIGFSLGGNIVLKLAGEAAHHPLEGLLAVAAAAPPIDLEGCSALISRPRNRPYEWFIIRNLVEQVRQQQRFFPDLPRPRFPRRMTMRLFDELYTAPRGGFADAIDYYRQASSRLLLPQIAVPTFILTARDDPLVSAEPLENLAVPSHVEVRITPRGGHLGFVGPDGAGGIRWAERRIVEWVARVIQASHK